MTQNAAVLETERFQRADLELLFGSDTVHGGDHREDGDREEQYRQYRTHRLALFHFAHRFFINNVVVLRGDHDGASESILDRVLQVFFVHIGDDVDLSENLIHRFIDHCAVFQQFVNVVVDGFVGDTLLFQFISCGILGLFFYHTSQLLRRDVRKAECIVIGHELILVGNADHVLARFDQPDDPAGDLYPLEFERQGITDRVIIRRGEFVAQPEAVTVCVVCSAIGHNKG